MENQTNPVMTTKDWLITLVVMAIPVVGFIMLFVWGFGSGTNENKANFCKAALIMSAIFIVLYMLFFAIFGAAIIGAMGR